MLLNLDPVREWFGHTRRERRASLILIAIIILILFARYLVPEQNMKIEDLSILLPDSGDFRAPTGRVERLALNASESAYDSASPDTRMNPGFYRNQTHSLTKYRRSEGRFSKSFADSSSQIKSVLDLNTCDSASLVALPGIGPVLASRIIKYRHLLGGYADVNQLKEVYGLTEETFGMVSVRVRADSSGIRRIPVNTADYRGLSRIIYLERYEISAILKCRQIQGRINSIEDLIDNKILSAEKAVKVKPYLDFR